ncbi:hypothetical protein N7510_010275 [Penicillium lagena]|uniref:uncharacterized protein n=1 Tax=Penicillium lagena TaxID=94218 RepID=UPI002540A74F|nr:uncharacterized protein N7510_010275 [Penicillium lagena]KAJ5605121.1 hypothetical protein N7510_010275 [Penicillium lagena]
MHNTSSEASQMTRVEIETEQPDRQEGWRRATAKRGDGDLISAHPRGPAMRCRWVLLQEAARFATPTSCSAVEQPVKLTSSVWSGEEDEADILALLAGTAAALAPFPF